MLGIARSRSEKRITLPPNRWNRITSFHLLPRDGALLLRLPQRMWAYSVSASISPNALFRAYFLFYQCDAKLQTVQWPGENTMTLDAPEPIAAYPAAEEAKEADALPAASPKTAV